MQSKDGRFQSQCRGGCDQLQKAMRWQLDSTCHRTWVAHSQAVRQHHYTRNAFPEDRGNHRPDCPIETLKHITIK